jgi:glutathione S-transferase
MPMKLHNSLGPNPRLVRLFMAEKGIQVDFVPVDLLGAENRRDEYKKKNPTGQLPCLELDDRTFLSETIAICEYLEDTHPSPALIGSTPKEKAESRMWTRRVELHITQPMANGFRYGEGLSIFKDRIRTIPQASDDLKALAREGLAWLDGMLEGKRFIVGDRFTLADIVLFSFLEFGSTVGQPIDPNLKNVSDWFARVGARPSVEASA